MPSITRDQVKVPVDVSPEMREVYIDNYMKATRETGRLMLFACDQKIEHMNKDFFDDGEDIDLADCEPEHLFRIADQGVCGFSFASWSMRELAIARGCSSHRALQASGTPVNSK